MNRRIFLMAAAGSRLAAARAVPSYLKGYEELWAADPRGANLEWFKNARFGMMICYGLYSLIGRGEWVMLRERIPVKEYKALMGSFTAARFDADFITDLALEAGMKYINLITRHHDGFALFRTQHSDFNVLNSPAKRDLVGEMATACAKKGLGFFAYYSYTADWTHPYYCSIEGGKWQFSRPAYKDPEPTYLWRKDEDTEIYIRFVHAQLRELLTQYGPLAGAWFDPIAGYYARPELFPVTETYALVRSLQKHILISFKQGANGEEDFIAPERNRAAHKMSNAAAMRAWEKNQGKPAEICNTLQPRAWGWDKRNDGNHRGPDKVMEMLADAAAQNANLCLNTGPLGDGSIPAEDVATLREVGRRLRRR